MEYFVAQLYIHYSIVRDISMKFLEVTVTMNWMQLMKAKLVFRMMLLYKLNLLIGL